MTIANTTNKIQYTGNGATLSFAFAYVFFADTDLVVTLYDTTAQADVVPNPVLNGAATYDYTVSGTFDADLAEYTAGANVIFTTAPPSNYRVTIERVTAATQGVTLIDNSKFPANTINGALDRLTVLSQRNAQLIAQALRVPSSDPSTVNPVLPDASARALQLLGFDGNGDPMVYALATDPYAASDSLVTATGSVTPRSLATRFAEFYDAHDFGAVGNNVADDTAAIQLAITTVAALTGGGTVWLPRGIYRITDALVVPLNKNVVLRGDGIAATIIRQATANKNGIQFSRTDYIAGGGLVDLTIEAGAGLQAAHYFGTGSSGIGVKLDGVADNFMLSNISVNNFTDGIQHLGCWNTRGRDVKIMMCAGVGLLIDKSATIGVAGGNAMDGYTISNAGFTGDNSASIGLRIRASGGEFPDKFNITGFNRGVVIDPRVAEQVLYLTAGKIIADTSTSDGWTFDGSLGTIAACEISQLWAGFNGGSGVVVKGANVVGVQAWGRIRENAHHGADFQAGGFHWLGGTINNNSRGNSNTYDGVAVSAGVDGWSLQNSFIGNDASSNISHQRNGVTIAAGASDDFVMTGLRMTGNLTSAFVDGSTAGVSNITVAANHPPATSGLALSDPQMLYGVSYGTPAAGATVYLGAGAYNAAEIVTAWRFDRVGLIDFIQAVVTVAPGVGETFVYTVRVNGVDSGLTCTIAGAAFGAVSGTPAVAVAPGDEVSIKLVTSASAALSQHGYNLRIE